MSLNEIIMKSQETNEIEWHVMAWRELESKSNKTWSNEGENDMEWTLS